MADDDLIFLENSERGQLAVAQVQELFARFDLNAHEAALVVGEIFSWAHVLGFMPLGKQKTLEQMDRSAANSRRWADENFDGFKARVETWAALQAGESGGRIQ